MAKWIVMRVIECEVEADSAGDACTRTEELPEGWVVVGVKARLAPTEENNPLLGETWDTGLLT